MPTDYERRLRVILSQLSEAVELSAQLRDGSGKFTPAATLKPGDARKAYGVNREPVGRRLLINAILSRRRK